MLLLMNFLVKYSLPLLAALLLIIFYLGLPDLRSCALRREDKRRAAYYHYYTGEEWRDAAGYDLSLDSQQLGEDGCVELIRNALPLFT